MSLRYTHLWGGEPIFAEDLGLTEETSHYPKVGKSLTVLPPYYAVLLTFALAAIHVVNYVWVASVPFEAIREMELSNGPPYDYSGLVKVSWATMINSRKKLSEFATTVTNSRQVCMFST